MDILIALFCSMSVGNCLFAIFQLNAWAHKSIYAMPSIRKKTTTKFADTANCVLFSETKPTKHILYRNIYLLKLSMSLFYLREM